jgi:hypothetical protein
MDFRLAGAAINDRSHAASDAGRQFKNVICDMRFFQFGARSQTAQTGANDDDISIGGRFDRSSGKARDSCEPEQKQKPPTTVTHSPSRNASIHNRASQFSVSFEL